MLFSGCATISAGNNTWLLMSDHSYPIILSGRGTLFTIYVIYWCATISAGNNTWILMRTIATLSYCLVGVRCLLFMLFSGCATISAGNNTWLLMSDHSYSIILSGKSTLFTIYVIYWLCYHFSW